MIGYGPDDVSSLTVALSLVIKHSGESAGMSACPLLRYGYLTTKHAI